MALKRRSASKALQGIKKVAQGVKPPRVENPNKKKHRSDTPLPSEGNVLSEHEAPEGYEPNSQRKTREFDTIKITGSKGQVYNVVVPISYTKVVPKTWEWTSERYRVAELIAEGIPLAQIPGFSGVNIKSRMTIYGWLEHPEFREHVDALILETGWASRRERIANLQHLNEVLLKKVMREIEALKLTDKSVGSLLTAIQAGSKLIAQEKGEFVEESKVTQDTNITGKVVNVAAKLDDFVTSKTPEEQAKLEAEFDSIGDDIIRSLTGGRD